MKALITVGISCSGKSTFAQRWISEHKGSRTEINRDVIRAFLVEEVDKNGPFTWAKWKWNREKTVTEEADKLLARAVKHGFDIICSDTNLNPKYRLALIAKLISLGYEVEVQDMHVSIETAWSRDAQRINGVGHSVIAKQHEQWLEYIRSLVYYTNTDNPIDFPTNVFPKYIPDVSKRKCVLIDLDGTAAKMVNRSAFEWDKVGNDLPDESVRLIINSLPQDVSIIFMSGRDSICRDITQEWLNNHKFRNDRLFMRAEGDMRKDTVIKEELFWAEIALNYNVQFVIDDRPSVCRMWRSIGLKVFQVGNPAIEF